MFSLKRLPSSCILALAIIYCIITLRCLFSSSLRLSKESASGKNVSIIRYSPLYFNAGTASLEYQGRESARQHWYPDPDSQSLPPDKYLHHSAHKLLQWNVLPEHICQCPKPANTGAILYSYSQLYSAVSKIMKNFLSLMGQYLVNISKGFGEQQKVRFLSSFLTIFFLTLRPRRKH